MRSVWATFLILKLSLFLQLVVPYSPAWGGEPGLVSCKQYKENINSLHKVFPPELKGEARCRAIPAECGPTGLLFNPDGMKTYYYRSQCYMDLALQEQKSEMCDSVLERKSFFFDGSYYSPHTCKAIIRLSQKDQAAPKISPENIVTITRLEAQIDEEKRMMVTLNLAPENPVFGTYSLALSAHYETESQHGKTAEATMALNPQHPNIYFKKKPYERFRLLSYWVIDFLPKSFTSRLTLKVGSRQIDRIQKGLVGKSFNLEANLRFVESSEGGLPEMKKGYGRYSSSKSKVISFD